MEERKCSHCGYEWKPRKVDPVQCPACKRYFSSQKTPWKIADRPEAVRGGLKKCSHCGYEWKPRKVDPVQCPACKQYFNKSGSGERILEDLKKAILEYNIKKSTALAQRIVDEKIDPLKALDAMTAVMRQVGDSFARKELWIPEVVGASDAMASAAAIIEEELIRQGIKKKGLGTVVAGTVSGDIHSIGKTMVCSLLAAAGFAVHDLGVDVSVDNFLKAVKKHEPDILAMSTLLLPAVSEQKKVIENLKRYGLRSKTKVVVGGSALSQYLADEIGADGYDPTALGAVKLVKKLTKK